eukprot:6490516-Amphidinium_carterae.1
MPTDTKLLHTLPTWQGAGEHYQEWAFQLRAYLGYCAPDVLRLLQEYMNTTQEDEQHFAQSGQDASRELYYLLALKTNGAAGLQVRKHPPGLGFSLWRAWHREHARKAEKQSLGLLQAILQYKLATQDLASLRRSLYEFELCVNEYAQVDRNGVQDSVLVAVIVRQLPESLRHHIELNLDDFSTYDNVRQLVVQQSEIRAEYKPSVYGTAALQNSTPAAGSGDDPMIIGAIPWQDKGKSKGGKDGSKGWQSDWSKGKGKSKETKGAKDKGNGKGKGTKGKGKSKDDAGGKGTSPAPRFNGYCSLCWRWGHKRADCYQRSRVNAVSGEEPPAATAAAEPADQEGRVAAVLTVPPDFVCAVRATDGCYKSESEPKTIFIDSCADENVVPRGWVPEEVRRACMRGPSRVRLFDVQGQPLKTSDAMTVTLELGAGAQVVQTKQTVVEADVTLAVLSAGLLSDSGIVSSFTAKSELVRGPIHVPMERVRNKFAVPVRVVGAVTERESVAGPASSTQALGEATLVREAVPGAASGPHVVGEATLVAEAAPMDLEVEAPKDIPMSLANSVEELRSRCRELSAPVWGSKVQMLARVREYTTKRKLEYEEQRVLRARHAARLRGDEPEIPFVAKSLREPPTPTAAERAAHELTHLPVAGWCEACLAGKARATPHVMTHPVVQQERRPPDVQLDLIFLGGRDVDVVTRAESPVKDSNMVPVLTAVDVQTGNPLAVAQPSKTVTEYMIQVVLEFLERLAHGRVLLFADGEPVMRALLERVAAKRPNTMTRYTPRYSGQAIGRLASMQDLIQGQIRTLKIDLEQRLGEVVPVDAPVFAWLVRHSSWLIARYHVMLNGRTAYFNTLGVAYQNPVLRFGEACMLRFDISLTGYHARGLRRAKAEASWQKVAFLGKSEKTEEFLCSGEDGL